MVEFDKVNDVLVLRYESQSGSSWVYERLNRDEPVTIKGTYHLTREHLYDGNASRPSQEISDDSEDLEEDSGDEPVDFKIAVLQGEYFLFDREILRLNCDLLIHKDVELTYKSFTAEKKVSIFQKISELRPGRIVIGGTEPDSLPEAVFNSLIQRFPNTHELKRYVSARVSSVVRSKIHIPA